MLSCRDGGDKLFIFISLYTSVRLRANLLAQSKDIYYPITAIDVSAASFSLKLNMAQAECEPFLFSIGL